MAETLIRPAAQRDLPALVEIFNHYVIHGHVTFDTALHTVESRQSWFESYGEGRHQLLVALTAERESNSGHTQGEIECCQQAAEPAPEC
jgi:L-amino acid N-acyltransferase YncA